jgi:hypothetical protein
MFGPLAMLPIVAAIARALRGDCEVLANPACALRLHGGFASSFRGFARGARGPCKGPQTINLFGDEGGSRHALQPSRGMTRDGGRLFFPHDGGS